VFLNKFVFANAKCLINWTPENKQKENKD